jgi:hypothetical protein
MFGQRPRLPFVILISSGIRAPHSRKFQTDCSDAIDRAMIARTIIRVNSGNRVKYDRALKALKFWRRGRIFIRFVLLGAAGQSLVSARIEE